MNAATDEFIDDQPPIGVLTDDARESLRLAIASTPENHPDKMKTISTIERGSRVIIYRADLYGLAGTVENEHRGLAVVRLEDGRTVVTVFTAQLQLA